MNSPGDVNAALTVSRMMIAWQQALFLRLLPSNRATHFAAQLFYLQLQHYLKPSLSLEVGAHQAEFSLAMRGLFPDLTAVAFEASPAVHRHFSREKLFHKQGVAYLNLALSDCKGMAAFNALEEFGGLSGRNSLLERDGAPGTKILVPATTGDAFLEDFADSDIALWIDVEGAAGKVLAGFSKSLAAGRFSSVFIEVEGKELWQGQWLDRQVTEFFLDRGYLPVLCDAEHCEPSFTARQYNLVFMRASDLTDEMTGLLVQTYLNIVDSVEIVKTATPVPGKARPG